MSEMAYATGGGIVQYACGHICRVVTTSVDTVPFEERGAMLCPECLKKNKDTPKIEIRLIVDYHASGRRTLKFQTSNNMPTDFSGLLFANPDAVSFYRAVAQKITELSQQGLIVNYQDASQ